MPSVYQIAKDYKTRLDLLDNQAVVFLLEEYSNVAERLKDSLDRLTEVLAKKKSAGQNITENDLYLEARYRRYIQLLREEMANYAVLISKTVSEAQAQAVKLALDSTEQIFRETYKNAPDGFDISFFRIDEFASRNIVARLSDISYLEKITGKIEYSALQLVREVLVNAVVQGIAPKHAASELVSKLDFARTKAETIARTEIISAFRNGNLERYAQADVVKGWQWSATLDDRTCPICIALDGRIFDKSVPFATHPSCRCSPTPVTKDWDEMGLGYLGIAPIQRPFISLRGEEWFRSLPEDRQRNILTKGKYELYRSGQIDLNDLVDEYDHILYGPSRQERSIKDLKRLNLI